MNLLNQIIQGVLLGGYYALLACGLSFMFGVMRIINLAHGSLTVVAAYLLWLLAEPLGWHPLLALLAVVPAMALLGWLLHKLVLERSARLGALVPLLATFGLASVIDNVLFQHFGADTRSLATSIGTLAYDSWELPGGLYVGKLPTLVLVLAVLLLGGLHAMLAHTSLGRQIRAASEDADTARLVGVRTGTVFAAASAITMVTVTLAGASLAQQLIFAFEAVIIGGAGSLWGTLLGGVVLGVAQNLGAQVHPQGFLIAGHATFLVILLARLYASGALRRFLSSFRRAAP